MIQIGNVLVNDFGSDYIDDNEPEYREILHNVEKNSNYYTADVIANKKKWTYLKELSKNRRNMIEWINFAENMEVLEINAGCGINSSVLARKVKSVTSIEESKIKCLISANMNHKFENLTVNHSDIASFKANTEKKYDAVILVGLFEAYLKNKNSYTSIELFLNTIKSLIKKDGYMYIATNNKYGLKYWAGCPETITGHYFEGIEGFPSQDSELAFSKKNFESVLKDIGMNKIKFYYPYPDYLFPTAIYSDDYLPKKGELTRNIHNFDWERLVLFDEEKVFDNLISDELFPQYSNSYFVIAQGE